ncbi:MAG TPA: TetR/AcrR family transcriptional regulator [Stellaceae bacterium]|nr:TetR/AcrR family transcriptional regulator [Stellaceae bacterium]
MSMVKAKVAVGGTAAPEQVPEPPPRERILAAARELFYRHGIHAIGVDAIAEAAGTNKMTLYRHFDSKDALVVECLRRLTAEFDVSWDAIAAAHAGDPKGHLLAWLKHIGEWKLSAADRGCALANTAVELSDPNHPARRFIDEQKTQHREKLVGLCCEARLREPELLADKVFLMCEGARVSLQSVGPKGPAARLVDMLQGLVAEHAPMRAGTG